MHIPNGMELIVIMAVVLLVFGPNKLPEIARTLAKTMNEFKGAMRDVTQHLDLHSMASETRVYPSSPAIDAKPAAEYNTADYMPGGTSHEPAAVLPAPAAAALGNSSESSSSHSGNQSLSIG